MPRLDQSARCFHCDLHIPTGTNYVRESKGETRVFCCPACIAVHDVIADCGFSDYYRFRQAPAQQADDVADYTQFDVLGLEAEFLTAVDDNICANLLIADVHCSACAWLIEKRLSQLDGVVSATMNLHRRYLQVQFRPNRINLSSIMSAIHQLGYRPSPWAYAAQREVFEQEKGSLLRRLGVAGILMMQVGMMSIGLYAGEWQGMEPTIRDLLRMASAVLSTIAVAYCATPFFYSAWRSINNRSVNMDVPVSLAILAAYFTSMFATLTRAEAIYFDTVCMFVFFLLLGRFIELRSREPNLPYGEQLLPVAATKRFEGDDGALRLSTVPLSEISIGDIVLCSMGEKVPCDGVIVEGESCFDESPFTGEGEPAVRRVGQTILAGSVNIEQPVWLRVEKTGAAASIHQIERLLDQTRSRKPKYAQFIDRLSPFFISAVLFAALLIACYWALNDPANLLMATLAVLVVSCPCALSLATPVAVAAANSQLRGRGIIPASGRVLDCIPKLTHIVFDKTGTLTQGKVELVKTEVLFGSEIEALAIAASLERFSQHPFARAVCERAKFRDNLATDVTVSLGNGVQGVVDNTIYRIGKPEWSKELCSIGQSRADDHAIWLCNQHRPVAKFYFEDVLRANADTTISRLHQLGYQTVLMSGDNQERVNKIAEKVGVRSVYAAMKPLDKLMAVKRLQALSATVLMVGDGVNDAPVLAGADVSFAMSDATDLSKSKADAVILSNDLSSVVTAIEVANACHRVVKQNIAWALLYNATTIPLAAMALLPPWLAAAGMSLSSLFVVMNAKKLSNSGGTGHGAPMRMTPAEESANVPAYAAEGIEAV